MKMATKRYLSWLLFACLIVALIPVAGLAEGPSTDVRVYRATPLDPLRSGSYGPSTKYTVSVNDTTVPAIKYDSNGQAHMDVTRFATEDPTPEIKITMQGTTTINTVEVYPKWFYPQSALQISADRKTLTFNMSPKLRYCIVAVNGTAIGATGKPYLTIISDKPEDPAAIPDKGAPNVLDFKAFSDQYLLDNPITDTVGQQCRLGGTIQDYSNNDNTLYTWTHRAGNFVNYTNNQVQFPDKRARQPYDVSDALQAALEKIKNDPALDTLYFPDGVYFWSGLRVHGWNGDAAQGGKPLHIYTEEGVLMQNRMQECRESNEPAIYFKDSSYITVSGRGIIDGLGAYTHGGRDNKDARNSPHQGGSMLRDCQFITFNDTYVRDVKQWNWECHNVEDIFYNNIKGLSPYNHSWVDGLDLTSGKRVYVDGAITLGNDDHFAAGHYNPSDEFPRRIISENRTAEMTGEVMAAAYYYNRDRLLWDTKDTEDMFISNTLHYSLNIANGIRLGHNTIGANAAVNGTYGRRMKNYVFDNFHSVAHNGTGARLQNGNLSSRPMYESFVIKNSSFNATNAMLDIMTATTGNHIMTNVRVENCNFYTTTGTVPAATFTFRNITNLSIHNMYINGVLQRVSPSGVSRSGVTNYSFTFDGNTPPIFTSPVPSTIAGLTNNPVAFTVSAVDTDPGDEVMRLEAVASTMPAGATFDPATGAFFWMPPETAAGSIVNIRFLAYDKDAVAGNDFPGEYTVTINVASSGIGIGTTITCSEDAHLQTWNTEKTQNYGGMSFLRVRVALTPNATNGFLNEKFNNTSTSNTTDIKLTLLKFNISSLTLGAHDKVELQLTYLGRRGSSGTPTTNSIRVANFGNTTWNQGTRTGAAPATGDVTWNSIQPTLAGFNFTTANTKTSQVFDASFSAGSNPPTGTAIDGTRVIVDVTDFVRDAKAAGQTNLNLALNAVSGVATDAAELYFVSREGAGVSGAGGTRLTAANTGMAPQLIVTSSAAASITGPASLRLEIGYGETYSGYFTVRGGNTPLAVSVAGSDKVTWDAATNRLKIAEGLAGGAYPLTVTVTDSEGMTASHVFTLHVVDKAGLAAAIEDFGTKNQALYTPASWNAAVAACAAAEIAFADPNILQAGVDAAAKALNDAIDALLIFNIGSQPVSVVLRKGASYQININTNSPGTVVYLSSNANATVSPTGLVTAARTGSAVITVIDVLAQDYFTITINITS